MRLIVARRAYRQEGFNLDIKITFTCPKCGKEVVPDILEIGRAHVYATHCGITHDVGLFA